MEEIILAVQILGFAGLVFWIEALRRAVKAQKETIAAQSEMLSSVQRLTGAARNVLDSVDETKMLDRLKAYKEFVDREKEAALKAQAEQFTNEKSRSKEVLGAAFELLSKDTAGYIDLSASLIPFVPAQLRVGFIQALDISNWHKERLLELAKAAPDISTREGRLAGVGIDSLAGKTESLLQALLLSPPKLPSSESKGGFMTDKPTDVSGGSAIYGQQIDVPNKREMLLGILQELESEGAIEPGWAYHGGAAGNSLMTGYEIMARASTPSGSCAAQKDQVFWLKTVL